MPSVHRRGQDLPAPQSEPFSDSDELNGEEDEGTLDDGETMGDEDDRMDGDDDDEEDEEDEGEPLASPTQLDNTTPIPPNLREISTLASWTVSSSKPGCSIPQLRSPLTSLFWQSDGPQPHYLNIHFFKLVRIVGLRLFLDFEADESYTPTRIVFLAGSGGNDLVEWGEMRLEQPRGWIWADFSGVGDADSDDDGSDDDDDDDDNDDQGDEREGDNESESTRIPGLADAPATADEGNTSDFENAQPRAALTTPRTAGIPAPTMNQLDTPPGQRAYANPDATPIRPAYNLPPQMQQHPQTSSPSNSTPTLTRNHPRLPFQPIHSTPSLPAVIRKTRNPKMPVLRAHLVQIKILENHQNGKDTHLRGLQIFARDNKGGRSARAAPTPMRANGGGGGGGGGGGDGGNSSSGAPIKVSRTGRTGGGGGMGGMRGLGLSDWDVEGSIR